MVLYHVVEAQVGGVGVVVPKAEGEVDTGEGEEGVAEELAGEKPVPPIAQGT